MNSRGKCKATLFPYRAVSCCLQLATQTLHSRDRTDPHGYYPATRYVLRVSPISRTPSMKLIEFRVELAHAAVEASDFVLQIADLAAQNVRLLHRQRLELKYIESLQDGRTNPNGKLTRVIVSDRCRCCGINPSAGGDGTSIARRAHGMGARIARVSPDASEDVHVHGS